MTPTGQRLSKREPLLGRIRCGHSDRTQPARTDESARDRAWVNDAITWLEEDHFCRQSGFLKQRLHRRLRQVELNAEQANRLQQVILDVAVRGPRQELKDVARSARYLDSPALRSSLKELIEHPPGEPETRVEHDADIGIDFTIRQRAKFLLGACEQRPTPRSRPPVP